MNFNRFFLVASLSGAVLAMSPAAHATDCSQNSSTPGWDVLDRAAQATDCANNRLQNYRQKSDERMQQREQALKDREDQLRNDTTGRLDRAREAGQEKLQAGRDRIDAIRNAPQQKMDQLRNAGNAERQNWDNMRNQTRSDVDSLLGGGQ
ncbi:hypothetical protein CFR73_06650 [Novacetimonas maltaceti]|uniref:Uncharacterized protein n=2 Tax=Novacetimonas maltaceti TaxID=1203393 RepID=A0A2S3W2Z6_9PROT|nr:hypothetical protein KMAL_12650 [Novacetimonas maltaceti]PYD60636.1 hypothetical protein CFR73_06650 [Novacetimonas maltaceti]